MALNSLTSITQLQGPPTHDGFFEFDILDTQKVVTTRFDGPNFSKHVGI